MTITKKPRLLLRADASTQIGTGHVMRCLALAQAWQDAGGLVHFAAVDIPERLEMRLRAENMTLHRMDVVPGSHADAIQCATLAKALNVDWVVEDGYQFGADFQHTIKGAGLRLLAIDDYGHASHYCADLVLNQNIYANSSVYSSREPNTRLLLGTQYVLLRQEFWRWCSKLQNIPVQARKVLVTMGGSDPDNVTLKVIEALNQVQFNGLELIVVVGASNKHLRKLQDAIRRSPHKILIKVNVRDMPELMDWAELAVSAGGSTCWEFAFMGVPTLCLSLAENQLALAKGLNEAGAALDLGWHATVEPRAIKRSVTNLLLSQDSRRTMNKHGQDLVDGQGVKRVIRLLSHGGLILRPVRSEDRYLIWKWANDPAARANSFSSEPIPWEQHLAWFERRLADPLTKFYLAEDIGANPIGQIRFQVEGEAATVSLSLAPEQRGKGYGSELIGLGSQQIWNCTGIKQIHAYIKSGNDASMRVFARAGYLNAGAVEVQGVSAIHYLARRPQEHG